MDDKEKINKSTEDTIEDKDINNEVNTDLENKSDDNTEEMNTEEINNEIEDDKEDIIDDEVEQPFYATNEDLDKLRDILPDIDNRLFLINDKFIVVGRLNGADEEILVKKENNNNDESAEDSYEYVKAPSTFKELQKLVNVVYLSPDLTEEEAKEYEGKEANTEELEEFLMNQLPKTIKDKDEDNDEDKEEHDEDSEVEHSDKEKSDEHEDKEEHDEDKDKEEK